VDDRTRTAVSKFLSFVLRHHPAAVGVTLDQSGWVDVESLLSQCQAHGRPITRAMLDEVVATSPKRRFAFSEDGTQIRASQGHTVAVDLGYEEHQPPEVLFHGTFASAVPGIRARGLMKMRRHHVHLSSDLETATLVGSRRGRPIVLRVQAGRMHSDGRVFYMSANGVWLTEHVPPEYIEFSDE
jgi:putative RNA 2'-phosphotransferase